MCPPTSVGTGLQGVRAPRATTVSLLAAHQTAAVGSSGLSPSEPAALKPRLALHWVWLEDMAGTAWMAFSRFQMLTPNSLSCRLSVGPHLPRPASTAGDHGDRPGLPPGEGRGPRRLML